MWRSFKLKGFSTVHVSMCPKLNCHLPCVWTLELTMYPCALHNCPIITDRYLYLSFTQRSRAFYCRLLAWGTSNPSHDPKSTDCSIIILCTHSPRKRFSKAASELTYEAETEATHAKESKNEPFQESPTIHSYAIYWPRTIQGKFVTPVIRIRSERISINESLLTEKPAARVSSVCPGYLKQS